METHPYHISCVMPTTVKRLWCLERSIRCWLRQTWQDRDLLIVSDGPGKQLIRDKIKEVAGKDPRVMHYHRAAKPATLGEKYNVCIKLAEGPYIAFWADDDWNHQARLEVVMRGMQDMNVRVGGTKTMVAYRTRDKQAFLYLLDPLVPHLIQGTVVVHKDICLTTPFRPVQSGSDTLWIMEVLWPNQGAEKGEECAVIQDPRLYVAFVHGTGYEADGGNNGNQLDRGKEHRPVWDKLVGYDLRHLIREDRAMFGLDP